MSKYLNKVSDYIEQSESFAQPILVKIRDMIHAFCPEVEEGWKWNSPYFLYHGKILCNMAAFKKHCSVGFWLQTEMKDPHGIFKRDEQGGMGSLGKIYSLEDLPQMEYFGAAITQAMELTDQGVKPRVLTSKREPIQVVLPKELADLLNAHPLAKKSFEALAPSHKREYVDWVSSAKKDETKARRLLKLLEKLVQGKSKE